MVKYRPAVNRRIMERPKAQTGIPALDSYIYNVQLSLVVLMLSGKHMILDSANFHEMTDNRTEEMHAIMDADAFIGARNDMLEDQEKLRELWA